MWPGCIVTGLEGTLSSIDMKNDLFLHAGQHKPYLKHYYSRRGAFSRSLLVAMVVCLIGMLAAVFMVDKRGRRSVLARIVAPTLCMSLLILVLVYLVLPKTNVTIFSGLGHIQLARIEEAIENYKLDVGSYPTTEQGLDALVRNPGIKKWDGPYIRKSLMDLWGMPHYLCPGKHGDYDLSLLGKDRATGGKGLNQNITNWEE